VNGSGYPVALEGRSVYAYQGFRRPPIRAVLRFHSVAPGGAIYLTQTHTNPHKKATQNSHTVRM